jgi:hypothetical protein
MVEEQGGIDAVAADVMQEAPEIEASGGIDYSFLPGASPEEIDRIRGLEEAAEAEGQFSPEGDDRKIPLPGCDPQDPEQWIVLRRINAFQARRWRMMSSQVSMKARVGDDGEAEADSMEGKLAANLADAYLYICQTGIERYRVRTIKGKFASGGYSRQADGASERGQVEKTTRNVFGNLSPQISDWLERVLMTANSLSPEARARKQEPSP